MKLLAIVVTAFYLFASVAAFGQTGGPTAADARQTASLQVSQTIKVKRSGSQPSAKGPSRLLKSQYGLDDLVLANHNFSIAVRHIIAQVLCPVQRSLGLSGWENGFNVMCASRFQ